MDIDFTNMLEYQIVAIAFKNSDKKFSFCIYSKKINEINYKNIIPFRQKFSKKTQTFVMRFLLKSE